MKETIEQIYIKLKESAKFTDGTQMPCAWIFYNYEKDGILHIGAHIAISFKPKKETIKKLKEVTKLPGFLYFN
jgi:hypothetical protein